MFALKKIITPFLMPPGIFIALFLLIGIGAVLKKKVKRGVLLLFISALMWATAIPPVSDTLLRGLEKDFSFPENPRGDVLILLGGGVNDKVPDMTGPGFPSGEALARLVTAARLQKRLDAPVIVSGGRVFDNAVSEAAVYRRILIDLGMPPDRIIVDDKSRDTRENAFFCKRICTARGFKAPILVTSAYHMKRAIRLFEKTEIRVTPFPAGFKTHPGREYHWTDFLPNGYGSIGMAIHEYLGLIYARLLP